MMNVCWKNKPIENCPETSYNTKNFLVLYDKDYLQFQTDGNTCFLKLVEKKCTKWRWTVIRKLRECYQIEKPEESSVHCMLCRCTVHCTRIACRGGVHNMVHQEETQKS